MSTSSVEAPTAGIRLSLSKATKTTLSFSAGCLRNLLPSFAPISLQWFSLYVSFSNISKATTVTHTKRIYRNLLRKETSFVYYTSSVLVLHICVLHIFSLCITHSVYYTSCITHLCITHLTHLLHICVLHIFVYYTSSDLTHLLKIMIRWKVGWHTSPQKIARSKPFLLSSSYV